MWVDQDDKESGRLDGLPTRQHAVKERKMQVRKTDADQHTPVWHPRKKKNYRPDIIIFELIT